MCLLVLKGVMEGHLLSNFNKKMINLIGWIYSTKRMSIKSPQPQDVFCVCAYLHMVYVTHTEAPRKEGKQRSVMKMVVIWLTLYGFLGA